MLFTIEWVHFFAAAICQIWTIARSDPGSAIDLTIIRIKWERSHVARFSAARCGPVRRVRRGAISEGGWRIAGHHPVRMAASVFHTRAGRFLVCFVGLVSLVPLVGFPIRTTKQKIDQTDQTDRIDQPDQIDQIDETDQTDETDQPFRWQERDFSRGKR